MSTDSSALPSYMDLLPRIYQRVGDAGSPLIAEYLKIFEKILTGEASLPEDCTLLQRKGLGQTLDILAELFYPRFSFLFDPDNKDFIPPILGKEKDQKLHETTLNSYVGATYAEYSKETDSQWQEEFTEWTNAMLDWMGRRIALSFNPEWDVDTRRRLAAGFMPYFRARGTAACLQQLLCIFLGNGDPENPLKGNEQIGSILVYDLSQRYLSSGSGSSEGLPIENYRVGDNVLLLDDYLEGQPVLGGVRPYAWLVRIVFKKSAKADVQNTMDRFNRVLEEEKPAIGCCTVQEEVPFMVGPDSATQLGVNAFLISPNSVGVTG